MTLYCGIEDPLGSNEQLYSVTADGSRELATFANEDAARVTLLSTGSDSAEIVEALRVGLASVTARAVDGWGESTPQSFQDKAALKRYERLGVSTVRIADGPRPLRFVAIGDEEFAFPLVASSPNARRAILVGELGWEAFVQVLPLADAREWTTRGPAPSEALVRILVEHRAALGYQIRDDLGRFGIVFVGAHAGVVPFAGPDTGGQRFLGSEAARVLRLGPGAP